MSIDLVNSKIRCGIRCLADLHHGGLFESLAMLFEDRFGWQVFRPIGMEWYREGYWKHHLEAVAHQYLDPYPSDQDCGDYFERPDASHPPRRHKLVTLAQARDLRLNFTLATLTENEVGFHRFAREVGAKAGIQVGNRFTHDRWDCADFAMLSAVLEDTRGIENVPYVCYRQEFDLNLFRFEYPPRERDLAATWVNCLSDMPDLFDYFKALANDVPELRWKCYGHYRENNPYWEVNLSPVAAVSGKMRAARVGIQFKWYGDGMGHVAHNLFACGKPVVATASYYKNQMAGPLFVDGVNSLDVQTHSYAEVVAWVKRLALDDEFHQKVSEASYRRFKEVVDFEEDAEKVRRLLERVLP